MLLKCMALAPAALASMAISASAASFSLDTFEGTFTSLDASYSLIDPVLPHDIVAFNGDSFGGLLATDNAKITATYVGSEAGANNSASLDFGAYEFTNSSSVPGDSFTFTHSGGYVALRFFTDNLGGTDAIDNFGGEGSDDRLNIAFTDITGATGNVASIYAFFGDGGGDQDFDDMVIRLDIAQVPVPAAGLLLVSGLIGFGAIARRRKQTS